MLSSEDKKDVKGAFGKALANKVSKATNDGIKKKPTDFLKYGRHVKHSPLFEQERKRSGY